MGLESQTAYEQFLARHDAAAWTAALAELRPLIHEVDRNAVAIWFAFYPLLLQQALAAADDPARLAQKLLLQGKYLLRDQIDSSHTFLYGHRFWPQVKEVVAERATKDDDGVTAGLRSLVAETQQLAGQVSGQVKADQSLVNGITFVALMTLRQVGLAAFKSAPGIVVRLDAKDARQTPEHILRGRARDDSQGLLGNLLRTMDKVWTVVWNEHDPEARFKLMHRQEIATAAATDQRDWSQADARCTIGEGPIPVQCRSASCGTCWIGVLGGAEKLSDMSERECRKLREFGYLDAADNDERPLIRLACQAQGGGALSVVIPPWNGVFGKDLAKVRESESEVQSLSE